MSSYGFPHFAYGAYPGDGSPGGSGGNGHPYHYHQSQPVPSSPPYAICRWRNCGIVLDDLSGPGIKRHLLQFHAADMPPKGSAGQSHGGSPCMWDDGSGAGCCQVECRSAVAHGRHVSTVHLGQGRMVCQYCTKHFSRKDALKRHQEQYCPVLLHGPAYGAYGV
ncbi:hypothetical protein DAEQUDRAFT_725442 [Daedalea quercina L-15889]|uniref:C2H2-type domain-containing protein n=1 Tax=Daedalea quercina L-15889 TaxID=1314783 RepID=A0A165RAN6_9APHY|nr:hypothetical protein DAEQUDRAFT_725442 [Daedalea quercina L-15889]